MGDVSLQYLSRRRIIRIRQILHSRSDPRGLSIASRTDRPQCFRFT